MFSSVRIDHVGSKRGLLLDFFFSDQRRGSYLDNYRYMLRGFDYLIW